MRNTNSGQHNPTASEKKRMTGVPFQTARESLELFLRLSENRLSAKIILRACKSDRKDRYVFMLKKEIVAA